MAIRMWTIFTRHGNEATALALPQALAELDDMTQRQGNCMVMLIWCGTGQADWLEIKLLRADALADEMRGITLGELREGWYRRTADPAQKATLCQLIGPLAPPQAQALQGQMDELQALRSKLTAMDQEWMCHANTMLAEAGDPENTPPRAGN